MEYYLARRSKVTTTSRRGIDFMILLSRLIIRIQLNLAMQTLIRARDEGSHLFPVLCHLVEYILLFEISPEQSYVNILLHSPQQYISMLPKGGLCVLIVIKFNIFVCSIFFDCPYSLSLCFTSILTYCLFPYFNCKTHHKLLVHLGLLEGRL